MSESERNSSGAFRAIIDTALAVAPGLKNLVTDVKAELAREFTHTSMELVAVLFTGNGFVQYGPGQDMSAAGQGHDLTSSLASALFNGDWGGTYQPSHAMSHEHEQGLGIER